MGGVGWHGLAWVGVEGMGGVGGMGGGGGHPADIHLIGQQGGALGIEPHSHALSAKAIERIRMMKRTKLALQRRTVVFTLNLSARFS